MSTTLGQIKKYGHYIVGEHNYFTTSAAFIASNKEKKPVRFYYHDNVFSNVKLDVVQKLKLSDLYRDRAQQLRDSYDYLSLQYSGGSDSHNVLMSFLKNNIKLDQVVVQLPKEFVDRGYHNPNMNDMSAQNILSEWEYVIKPDLEYLAKHHPEIDIFIYDWLGNPESKITEQCFEESMGTFNMTFRLKHPLQSQNPKELEMLKRGKTVAIIFGVDKPDLILNENGTSVYFSIYDKGMRHHPSSLSNPLGTEYFYFTPEVPELPFKMALEVLNWFKLNPTQKHFLHQKNSKHRLIDRFQFMTDITKKIVYPYWNTNRFQVAKNNLEHDHGLSSPENDIPVYKSDALTLARDKWNYFVQDYFNSMDRAKLLRRETFPAISSKFYYLGELS